MSLHLVEGAVIADRFRLLRQIGRGGMGEVWLAHHTALDVPCAVKFINAEAAASPEHRARFEAEAKAAAGIRSTHVVQILDTGVFDGTPYIAMEHLDGEDLRRRLERTQVLDPRATASIVTQTARALERARAAGIVHRDLKPANLFLCRDGDREIVKVLDFGVAKRIGSFVDARAVQTRPDDLIGTPSYMSPEQVGKARLVDHRSDLWALGVITFRCLTGHAPFKSSSVFELLMQVTAGPIPVPSRIAAVPVGFDAWWARAAARDPDHRFQTAKELAEALHVALGLSSAPDLDELTPTVRLHGRDTTLRLDDPGQPRRPAPAELPEEEPIPLMVRAPSEGSPCAPGPLVTTIAPAIAAPARSSTKARIAVAFACMVLGGIAALYVVPRLAPSTARVQAGPGPSAPRVLPAIVAPAVPVTAAGTTSLVRPPPSASSAPAPPRAVTPLPLPAPSSTSSARSLVKVPAPPVTATAAGNPAYDPGI